LVTQKEYRNNIAVLEETSKKFLGDGQANKQAKGEVYVLVIGESETRDYMGVYSKIADNTPTLSWLAKTSKSNPSPFGNGVIFSNGYAFHTHTSIALTGALTNQNGYDNLRSDNLVSIIQVAKKAGFQTIWLSNQYSISMWGHAVDVIERQADIRHNTSMLGFTSEKSDEALLPYWREALAKIDPNKNTLIVVHIMGEHVFYKDRIFAGTELVPELTDSKIYGDFATNPAKKQDRELARDYLTAVFCTDKLLGEFMSDIQKLKLPAALIYFSDHGEELFNGATHAWQMFAWRMARIPLAINWNSAFEKKYPQKTQTLLAHQERVFTNDLIFDTLLGVAGINSPLYQPQFDLANSKYAITLDNARIGNHSFVQKEVKSDPLAQARKIGKTSKIVVAQRVNTYGKAREMLYAGLKNWEIDLKFQDGNLTLGHDLSAISLSLQEYLEVFTGDFNFLWINLKDIEAQNAQELLAELSAFNEKYNLKKRVLIESKFPEILKSFSDGGWETSLALDNAELNNKKTKQEWQRIASIIQQYKIGGCSFEIVKNDIVMQFVKPLIPNTIKFYGKASDISFNNGEIGKSLAKYWHLSRISIPYNSDFGD
jgi:hypothetical protein